MSLFDQLLPIGLQMDTTAVRMVQIGQNGRRIKILSFKEGEIPADAMQESVVVKKDVIINIFHDLLKARTGKWRMGSRAVSVSAPEHVTFYKLLHFDVDPSDITERLVYKELSYHLPYDMNEVYYDWKQIPNTSLVVTSSALRTFVDTFLEIVDFAGFQAPSFESEVEAVHRLILLSAPSSFPFVFAYYSQSRIVVGVSSRGLVVFTHSESFVDERPAYDVILDVLRHTDDQIRPFFQEDVKEKFIQHLFVDPTIREKYADLETRFQGMNFALISPASLAKHSLSPQEITVLSQKFLIPFGLALRDYAD